MPAGVRCARGASAPRAACVGRPAGAGRCRDDLLAGPADVILSAAIAMSGITGDADEAAVTRNGAEIPKRGSSATATWG